ncbi:hypothetical protein Maq22A_1p30850 (plasmid) [Methylobacterium aquaticum]|uniref:Uncharacterized protein n=1 Tax=Methylobacterium aquaticum TaxID=270351 RepID=A0A0C6FJ13_9HYPH|nr:hypothetical protein Maq22A_1p30850 [Methylobacterium aquaticum]
MRSITSGPRCCNSRAKAPSTRTVRVPGSGRCSREAPRRRDHSSFSGWQARASRSPTISPQEARMSVEAKPWAAKTGPRDRSISSLKGLGRAIARPSWWIAVSGVKPRPIGFSCEGTLNPRALGRQGGRSAVAPEIPLPPRPKTR